MANELKTAQVRITKNAIIAEGTGGAVVWMTPIRARLMLDNGAVELLPGTRELVGPAETQELGGPAEKKAESSAAGPDGPSTDSPSSGLPGAAESPSSPAEDPPSQGTSARSSRRRGGRAKL